MKRVVRLTEGDLHRIVKESVKRVLKEEYGRYKGVCYIGIEMPKEYVESSIDKMFEEGLSVKDIQKIIDQWWTEEFEGNKRY